ncbi:MAG: MBL fold metallo-hydrolase [Devosia sp.]|nr:MBL fold metallo-hydrolase [Devosia sp.]
MFPTATLTLIGGPTLLIEFNGLRLLTDPTFDLPGAYPSGNITLTKTTGPELAPADLLPIDAVLLSHDQHFDNLDRTGRAFLPSAAATLTTPAGARRLGGNAKGLAPWETTTVGSGTERVFVTAAPARHGPVGIEPISGDVTGFLIGVEQPGNGIYISGDTVWYEGVAEVAERFRPRLVVAFAGSAEPRGHFHLTMDSNDVIALADAFPEARIVAVHNEGWAHFKESPADLAQAMTALGVGERLVPLERGRALGVPLS